MNYIEVGDYVRNEDGYIQKLNLDSIDTIYKDEQGKFRKFEGEDVWGNEYSTLITKYSKDIIDLIEVGDYVNGQRVIGVSNISGWIDTVEDVIHKGHIKSIVTHEQYEANCYKVGE